jgi:abequosyltransferase
VDRPILSICIATYKRGKFIGETLDSIVAQLEPGVEVVVVDGASPDNTYAVMATYLTRYSGIRYYREKENSGVDQDYDKAVGYARGSYCWLMTDDDLLRPGAVRRVVSALDKLEDLIIVNAEVRTLNFSQLIEGARLPFVTDRTYGSEYRENFFLDCIQYMSFIGCVVIKREVWLARCRQPHYGSEFIHLGVIFQSPALQTIRVIAEPLISIRYGNAMWAPRTFEIWAFKYPRLIWSLPDLSEEAKAAATPREPWRDLITLFLWRATGAYSRGFFERFLSHRLNGLAVLATYSIGILPGPLANLLAILYVGTLRKGEKLRLFDLVYSVYSNFASRTLARMLGVSTFRN